MSGIVDPNAAPPGAAGRRGGAAPQFPPTSRYHGVEIAVLTCRPDGTPVAYLHRRLIPPPETYALLQEVVMAQGDRLDNLAARALGDPEQFWRICDANAVLAPGGTGGGGPHRADHPARRDTGRGSVGLLCSRVSISR